MSKVSKTTRNPRQMRDTGFPEPFGKERNTTLPHPEADLSPDACIGHNDSTHAGVPSSPTRTRSNMPFLHRSKKSHRKNSSYGGVITAPPPSSTSAVSLTPCATVKTQQEQQERKEEDHQQQQQQRNVSRPSIIETPPSPLRRVSTNHARSSFATTRGRDEDEEQLDYDGYTPPTSTDDASSIRSTRGKGLLGKFRRRG